MALLINNFVLNDILIVVFLNRELVNDALLLLFFDFYFVLHRLLISIDLLLFIFDLFGRHLAFHTFTRNLLLPNLNIEVLDLIWLWSFFRSRSLIIWSFYATKGQRSIKLLKTCKFSCSLALLAGSRAKLWILCPSCLSSINFWRRSLCHLFCFLEEFES